MAAIEVQEFSFAIGSQPILRDVSLEVDDAEYVTVVGPNGAGKTTLLKCLDRIVVGGTGRIEIAGRPLERYRQRELARLLSYVPQADGRALPFTVEQFVLMGRYPYLSPFSSISRDDRRTVRDLMEWAGVRQFAQRLLGTLSGGERQRVYIVAALAQGARILLLDEPTTFLDYRHQAEIRTMLSHLNRDRGVTILAVSHDVNAAALESRRLVALRAGSVVFSGTPAEIMRPAVLESIYETSFVLVEHPRQGLPMILPAAPGDCGPGSQVR